jgi:hypothetical protein
MSAHKQRKALLQRYSSADRRSSLLLADATEADRTLYNTIRPLEAIDFATPLSRYLAARSR